MEKFITTFENLVRRGIAPSVAFFVIFGVVDLVRVQFCEAYGVGCRLYQWGTAADDLFTVVPDGVLTLLALLLILGLSYVLTTVNQLVFDERLRKNFDGTWLWRTNNRRLRTLRARVRKRFREHGDLHRFTDPATLIKLDMTDYLLYEIIGGIDPEPTRSFVDSAKALGVVFVSWLLSLVIHGLLLSPPSWCHLPLILLILFFWWLGRESVKAQYRSRSIRHYVNFLMMPNSTLETLLKKHEIELKAKAGGA